MYRNLIRLAAATLAATIVALAATATLRSCDHPAVSDLPPSGEEP